MYVWSPLSAEYVSTKNGCRSCPWSAEQGNIFSPCPRLRLNVCFAKRVRPSCPASASSFCTLRLNLVLTHGTPPVFRDGVTIYGVSGHRVSPELIGSRKSVPIVFTAKSPLAQGKYSPQGCSSGGWCCLFRFHYGQIFVRVSFSTPIVCM